MWQNMDAKMCLRLHEQDLRRAMTAARSAAPVGSARPSVPGRLGAISAALAGVLQSLIASARAVRG